MMRPRINFITLAVGDLEKSFRFYSEGLGLPSLGRLEGYEDHVLFELENGFGLVLYDRTEFRKFSLNADAPVSSAGFIISHFASGKAEVDAILKRALAAGATRATEPREQAWGYTVNFADPDGHQWEITWNPDYNPENPV
ncbi:MAG: VOC family protein [Adhaeribacter sp.]